MDCFQRCIQDWRNKRGWWVTKELTGVEVVIPWGHKGNKKGGGNSARRAQCEPELWWRGCPERVPALGDGRLLVGQGGGPNPLTKYSWKPKHQKVGQRAKNRLFFFRNLSFNTSSSFSMSIYKSLGKWRIISITIIVRNFYHFIRNW